MKQYFNKISNVLFIRQPQLTVLGKYAVALKVLGEIRKKTHAVTILEFCTPDNGIKCQGGLGGAHALL